MSGTSQNVTHETGQKAQWPLFLLLVGLCAAGSAVMAETGGWYFNVFTADDTAVGITPSQAKARCFHACHKAQEARDYVFSDPRR